LPHFLSSFEKDKQLQLFYFSTPLIIFILDYTLKSKKTEFNKKMRSFNKIFTCFLIGCLLVCAAIGQTTVSGDLSNYKLDSSNNPFIVEGNIEVPIEKSIVIGPGCIFLFKMYTGFTIKGSLSVEGTAKNPVIFTTINDTLFNKEASQYADPFDWNGIIVDQQATNVVMKNFTLSYSVNGLKSQKNNIVIQSGVFSSNGQFNFTIFEKIIDVQDNRPFTFPLAANVSMVETSKDGQTSLRIGSDPPAAEIYIDKKPGKKVSPYAITPATISHIKNPSISVTLFKKNFTDTTISLNLISGKVNQIDITLSNIKPESVSAQNNLLHERARVKLGKVCLITTPFFLIGGAGLLYLSEKHLKKANEAGEYVNNSFSSSPNYETMIIQHKNETDNWKKKFYPGIALLGVGAIDCAIGCILYF
jgi:hypothetical protein